jgi:tRNA pseudouridine55 synthase
LSLGGVLLVRKPAGPTSHDIVTQVRRSDLGRGLKVGHAGTLDPFATGLLIVLIAQATRFQRYFMALGKTYRTTARLGAVSDTGDRTGTVTPTGTACDEATLREALPSLVGEVDQRVPLVSAVKVGGERLYRKARRGEQFETPVRTVRIDALELAGFDRQAQTAELEVACGSGTYVRQLVADLGELLGCGAYCEALERTGIGPFALDRAHGVEEVLAGRADPIGLSEALGFLPERPLDAGEERPARNGVKLPDRGGPEDEVVRLTAGGELVSVAQRREGFLRPLTVVSS